MPGTDEIKLLLFLDFDGVLHPSLNAGKDNFCALPLLEDLLRQHHAVGIIISSSWRHLFSFEELVGYFSEDVRPRIVASTRSVLESGTRNRWEEIADYLRQNNERRPYVVLDDSRFEFPGGCDHVLFCDSSRGFDNEIADRLGARLQLLKMDN